jgi:hypothetical protein
MMLHCLPDAATFAAMLGAEIDGNRLEEGKWESTS